MLVLRSTLLLLLLLVAANGAIDHLKEACGTTPHPKLCVSVLSTFPESKTGDARGLAEIAIRAATKMVVAVVLASDAEKEVADEVNRHENNSCTPAAKAGLCFYYSREGGGVKVALWMLEARNATDDAARFASTRFYFYGCRVTPYRAWDCGRCRVVARGQGLPGVTSKGSDTERFMEVASKLVALAPNGTGLLPLPWEEVYMFLNRMDFKYVHMPDDCCEKEPAPLKCYRSSSGSVDKPAGPN